MQINKTKAVKSNIRIKKPVPVGWSHKTVERVLQNNGLLQALKQHSMYLCKLRSLVSVTLQGLTQTNLPVDVSRYESGILKLYVSNSAIATRLRFLEKDLFAALTAHSLFCNLVKIMVRVNQSLIPTYYPGSVTIPAHSSCHAKLLLESGDDQQFQSALQRLSRHVS